MHVHVPMEVSPKLTVRASVGRSTGYTLRCHGACRLVVTMLVLHAAPAARARRARPYTKSDMLLENASSSDDTDSETDDLYERTLYTNPDKLRQVPRRDSRGGGGGGGGGGGVHTRTVQHYVRHPTCTESLQ